MPGEGAPSQGAQGRGAHRQSAEPQGPVAQGSTAQGPTPPRAKGDRPTEFIPKLDETVYIPKVEDFGAVSQGKTPAAGPSYPDRDPDEYQPRHGSIDDLTGPPQPPRPALPPQGAVPPQPPVPPQRMPGGYGADDRTEEHHFGNAFDSGYTTAFSNAALTDTTFTNAALDSGFHTGGFDQPAVPKQTGRTAVRTMGEVLLTAGMVVLLFVVYELYVTNIFSAQKQASATTSLDKEWDTVVGPARTNHYDLTDGHGIAKLYIPALGQDYHFTVIEGTTQPDLAIGPGHYVGSALPGQPGNFAIAGHRVGEGAPFNDLDLVQSCDAIVVETQSDWYVYRMLPTTSELAGWAAGRGATSQCSGVDTEAKVQPLGGMYAQTVGQEIVLPSEGDVVAPIPHHNGAQISAGQEASLLTLTTCNPKFSSAQRLILHAVLVKDWHKNASNPDKLPPEMQETS